MRKWKIEKGESVRIPALPESKEERSGKNQESTTRMGRGATSKPGPFANDAKDPAPVRSSSTAESKAEELKR
jgi:hypothetical protein